MVFGQTMATYEQLHRMFRRGESGGSLAGGVGPADDDDGLSRLDVLCIRRRVEPVR
jgi:hypothetical protein